VTWADTPAPHRIARTGAPAASRGCADAGGQAARAEAAGRPGYGARVVPGAVVVGGT